MYFNLILIRRLILIMPFRLLFLFLPNVLSSDSVLVLVYAINSLYAALGNPPLAGWLPVGGDPCGFAWQGVQCVNANITAMYESMLFSLLRPCDALP